MEHTHTSYKSYCIPHFAIHSGGRNETLPLDIPLLIEEVLREYPMQFSRMRLPSRQQGGAAGQKNMIRNATDCAGRNVEDIRPRSGEPAFNAFGAASATESAESESGMMEKDFFRRNRAQLFHPPQRRKPSGLKLTASALTLLIVLIAVYVLYVGRALNSILPSGLQYERPGLEQQLHRSGSVEMRGFQRRHQNRG